MTEPSNIVPFWRETTDLYRHFDKAGKLLYVGISLSAIARLRAHRDSSDWYDEISTVSIEKFNTREEALEAEQRAIIEERPLRNVTHNENGHLLFEPSEIFSRAPVLPPQQQCAACTKPHVVGGPWGEFCSLRCVQEGWHLPVINWITDCRDLPDQAGFQGVDSYGCQHRITGLNFPSEGKRYVLTVVNNKAIGITVFKK